MPITIVSGTSGDVDRPCVVWKNLALEATAWAASQEAAAAPNLAGPQTFDAWTVETPEPAPWVYFEVAAGHDPADTFAIIGHNLTGLSLTIDVWNGTTWTTVASIASIVNDRDLVFLRNKLGAGLYTRYRVTLGKIVSGSPVDVPAGTYISNLFFGSRLVFLNGLQPEYIPPRRMRDVEIKSSVSMQGQLVANRYVVKGVRGVANFNPHDWDWVQTNVVPFAEYFDLGGTFLWMGSPNQLPDDLTYAHRGDGDALFTVALTAGSNRLDDYMCRQAKMGMEFHGYLGA